MSRRMIVWPTDHQSTLEFVLSLVWRKRSSRNWNEDYSFLQHRTKDICTSTLVWLCSLLKFSRFKRYSIVKNFRRYALYTMLFKRWCCDRWDDRTTTQRCSLLAVSIATIAAPVSVKLTPVLALHNWWRTTVRIPKGANTVFLVLSFVCVCVRVWQRLYQQKNEHQTISQSMQSNVWQTCFEAAILIPNKLMSVYPGV